jgi:hypothetical protein
MKARPILFNGPMIRALLGGRKTQTRRALNPQPPGGEARTLHEVVWGEAAEKLSAPREKRQTLAWAGFYDSRAPGSTAYYGCPYGVPGDLLWCRETWAHVYGITQRPAAIYRSAPMYDGCKPGDFPWQWRPSIHMPRWASRITLEITDVAVERVQEIAPGDVAAEGIEIEPICCERPDIGGACCGSPEPDMEKALGDFRSLWDSINSARGHGWSENPWVWCLFFRVIEANVDEVIADPARYGLGAPA